MRILLENGQTVEGTLAEIKEFILDMEENEKPKYFSKSHGKPLAIKDMDTTHLKNATLKKVNEWLQKLYTYTDMESLVESLRTGKYGEVDEEFDNLLDELELR